MKMFWRECRETAQLSLKQMSRLLNISAHTYWAMEQGKIKIPQEILAMLFKIYLIPHELKLDKKIILEKIGTFFSSSNESERFYCAMKNLCGEGSYQADYRKIKKIKDEILD